MAGGGGSPFLRVLVAIACVLPFELVAKGTILLAFAAFALAPSLRPAAVAVVAVVGILGKLHKKYMAGQPDEPEESAQEPAKTE